MAEQRLVDANEAKKRFLSYYSFVNENTSKSNYTGETLMSYEVADMIEDCMDNAPTIDPETLPIVQQLLAELERVTAQRDELKKTCLSLVSLCEKEYRRNNFGMYRDERNDDLKRVTEAIDNALNSERSDSRYRSWFIGRFEKEE